MTIDLRMTGRQVQTQTARSSWRLIILVVLSALSIPILLAPGDFNAKGKASIKASNATTTTTQKPVPTEPKPTPPPTTVIQNTTLPPTMCVSLNESKMADNETVRDLIKRLTTAGVKLSVQDKTELLAKAWPKAVDLYFQGGTRPIIIGKERCEEFRRQAGTHATVAVVGLFNSGTNALTKNLQLNIGIPGNKQNIKNKLGEKTLNGILNHPPWWKHNPKINDPNWTCCGRNPVRDASLLPVLVIRDPLFWRKSMCTAAYNLDWKGRRANVCPRFWYVKVGQNASNYPIHHDPVTFQVWSPEHMHHDIKNKRIEHYESLMDLWNQFNTMYLEADFPRLIVRAEDALFYVPELMEEIRSCVGGYAKHDDYRMFVGLAKIHGNDIRQGSRVSSNPYLAAVQEATSTQTRARALNEAERRYTRKKLDSRLMSLFQYLLPGETSR